MPVAVPCIAALVAFAVAKVPSRAVRPGRSSCVALCCDLHVRRLPGPPPRTGTTGRTRRCASQPPGRLPSCPCSTRPCSTGASTSTTTCRRRASGRAATRRSRLRTPRSCALRLRPLNCGDWRPGHRGAASAARRPLRRLPRGAVRRYRPGVVRLAGAGRARLRRDRARRRDHALWPGPAARAAEGAGAPAATCLLRGLERALAHTPAHGLLGARVPAEGTADDSRARPGDVLGGRAPVDLCAGDGSDHGHRAPRLGWLASRRSRHHPDRPGASPRIRQECFALDT